MLPLGFLLAPGGLRACFAVPSRAFYILPLFSMASDETSVADTAGSSSKRLYRVSYVDTVIRETFVSALRRIHKHQVRVMKEYLPFPEVKCDGFFGLPVKDVWPISGDRHHRGATGHKLRHESPFQDRLRI